MCCSKNKHPNVESKKLLFVNTVVSSKMMKSMAQKEGIRYEECLTGFSSEMLFLFFFCSFLSFVFCGNRMDWRFVSASCRAGGMCAVAGL
jgi:hypothetical protein